MGDNPVVVKAKRERKVFGPKKVINKIPDEILNNKLLNEDIENKLPSNYNFEIHKTIWRIKQLEVKRVALQMPEGLLIFSVTLCDLIEKYTDADTVIMGDVTYGACCIDDFTAKALGVDFLVHYGHSCLIPIDQTLSSVKILYVFVDIRINAVHFLETVKHNFDVNKRLAFVSTIQFVKTLHAVANELRDDGYDVQTPQSKPLSPGEILGCTSPVLKNVDVIIYLGDGRFHIESIMIANPSIEAFRYDPYEKKFTREYYDQNKMVEIRRSEIDKTKSSKCFGLIFGTLGRQGSARVLEHLQRKLQCRDKDYVVILLSEIFPAKLELFSERLEAFIQTSCPRLSIDWGNQFKRPILSPYEISIALGDAVLDNSNNYNMDFYSNNSAGPWTPNYKGDICCGKSCSK